MNAEQVIELIKTLEPVEIERRFVFIKEYEAEVRRRQALSQRVCVPEEFEKAADKVFNENKYLFQMLAEYERKETGASAE